MLNKKTSNDFANTGNKTVLLGRDGLAEDFKLDQFENSIATVLKSSDKKERIMW